MNSERTVGYICLHFQFQSNLFIFLFFSYCLVFELASTPIMEQSPKNVTVLDGKDATIVCRAVGAPQPNVTWTYNGECVI